jgi:Uma2 family endonuclease
MTGASPEHNLIALNIGSALNVALSNSPCRVYSGDQRIRADVMNTFRYADVSVACDEPKFSEDNPASLLNPVLLVEVLSESTEMADRGAKLMEYQSIPSLQTYLLVSQDAPIVQAYFRDGEAWRFQTFADMAAEIVVPVPNCTLTMSAIYQKVEFEEQGQGGQDSLPT